MRRPLFLALCGWLALLAAARAEPWQSEADRGQFQRWYEAGLREQDWRYRKGYYAPPPPAQEDVSPTSPNRQDGVARSFPPPPVRTREMLNSAWRNADVRRF
jgi:hypothetical protein